MDRPEHDGATVTGVDPPTAVPGSSSVATAHEAGWPERPTTGVGPIGGASYPAVRPVHRRTPVLW
ncbi:hypothetical protein DSY14_23005 [Nocardiopsis sp. MG754419]|nr:hypothetical protein [Nocardiopsis sp. MG754419]